MDTVKFKFMYAAEYLKTEQILVIREGRTKIFGYVTKLLTGGEKDEQIKIV